MPRFAYPCPGCRTTNSLHDAACDFEGTGWNRVEKAYTDLLAVLVRETITEDALRHATHGEWSGLHNAALDLLVREGRVQETDAGLRLLTAEEYREAVSEPTTEPMATIYRQGSYPGCHDHSVFAMIAWYEMVGLSWEEARENVVDWLRESGTWARGGFEESSPEEVVDNKRHVYAEGYGWKQAGEAAKRVIDRRT